MRGMHPDVSYGFGLPAVFGTTNGSIILLYRTHNSHSQLYSTWRTPLRMRRLDSDGGGKREMEESRSAAFFIASSQTNKLRSGLSEASLCRRSHTKRGRTVRRSVVNTQMVDDWAFAKVAPFHTSLHPVNRKQKQMLRAGKYSTHSRAVASLESIHNGRSLRSTTTSYQILFAWVTDCLFGSIFGIFS